MTWIRRSESAPPSKIVVKRDEETGDRSEVQTRVEESSEIDNNDEASVIAKARKAFPSILTHTEPNPLRLLVE